MQALTLCRQRSQYHGNPAVTTTYYVRAEGDCNNSNAVK